MYPANYEPDYSMQINDPILYFWILQYNWSPHDKSNITINLTCAIIFNDLSYTGTLQLC